MLQDNDVTEVYSNGVVVWSDGKISKDADAEVYITQEGCLIEESRLDFNVETIDYWTRLEHTYVGMFIKSFLDNFDGTTSMEILADDAIKLAHALVEKMKEERK